MYQYNRYQNALIRYAREFAENMDDVIEEGFEDPDGPSMMELAVSELVQAMEKGRCTGAFKRLMLQEIQKD